MMNTKLLVALTCLVAMALSACKSDPVAVEEQHSAGDLSSTTIKIEARNPDPINKDGGDGQASLVAHATTSSSSEPSRPSGPSPEYNLTGSYATDGNGSGTVTPLSSGAGKTGDGEQWNPLNAASADVPTSLTWTPYTVTYQLGGSSHSYTFDQYQQAVMQQLQQARQDAEAGYTPTLSSSDTSMPDSYSIADFEQQGYEVRDLGNDRIEVRRAIKPNTSHTLGPRPSQTSAEAPDQEFRHIFNLKTQRFERTQIYRNGKKAYEDVQGKRSGGLTIVPGPTR